MNNKIKQKKASYKTEAEAVLQLEELEMKADLFKYQLDGYSAWRLLRFKMAGMLQNLPFSASSTPFGLRWVSERLMYFFKEIPIFLSPKRKDVVVKTVSTALSEEENGFYRDIYFDDLFKNSDECFKIETLNNPQYAKRRKKALIPITVTTALIDLITAFFSFLRIPFYTSSIAVNIYNDISHDFDVPTLTVKDIQLSLLRFYWSKRLYKRLLSKVKPKITLSADPGQFAFWAASHELGVPTVEFQHGVFTRVHPNALNITMSKHREHLLAPDKIFLFGEYWKQQLLLNRYYQEELVVVGSPRIDRYRKLRKEILSIENQDKDNITILLTSQGLDLVRLIAFIREFLDIAESKIQYTLYIKLHPAEREKTLYVQELKDYPQVKILYGFEQPSTFELMVNAHLHISIASASHYDALGLSVPTAILPLAGHELVQHLADSGHAHELKKPQDLLNLVMNIHNYKVLEEVSYYYYEPNALENIKRELSLLVK